MNTSTKNLENDHVHILRLIDVMEQLVQSEHPEAAHLEEVVSLIRNFADGLHHAKEENLLFPLMGTKGFPAKQGPIAVMLSDHEQGRAYVKQMDQNIQLYKNGELSALNLVYQNMMGYANLLQEHIGKENNVLFRMADNVFSGEEQRVLLEQFALIDEGSVKGVPASEYIERIERLVKIYLPAN